MLIFDYLKQDQIRRFLDEFNPAERFKTIVSDGCVIVHDCLAYAAATRTGKSAKRYRGQNLNPLALEVLSAPEMKRLLDVILAVVKIRNAADHEPVTDDEIRVRFLDAIDRWKGSPFPGRGQRDREVGLAHVTFAWIALELNRWQAGLEPSWKSRGPRRE